MRVDLDGIEDTSICLRVEHLRANLPYGIGRAQIDSLILWTGPRRITTSTKTALFTTSTIPEAGIQCPGAEQALSHCCAGS
jgi:hypothetical protein